MASPIKDPRWIIAALIMIVATSFNFLNTSAVAQSGRNDTNGFSMVRGLIANHEKLIDKHKARIADLEKVLEQAKKYLADHQDRSKFWRQILSSWELQSQKQDQGMLCVVDEPTKLADKDELGDELLERQIDEQRRIIASLERTLDRERYKYSKLRNIKQEKCEHRDKWLTLIEGDFPFNENVLCEVCRKEWGFPGRINEGKPHYEEWNRRYRIAEQNKKSVRCPGGGFCTYDEPSKAEPVRRIVRKIVGYDKVCRGNYCEMIPRYADVEVVELPIDEPIVSSTYDQPPACDDPSVATTSIVRNLSSSDGPPGCPCEVCECENCIYDQASMTSFLAGESPARVKGFQPVRSFLQSRPLRSFLQARPVRSFFGRLFGR